MFASYMLGTIINTTCIIIGSSVGCFFHYRIVGRNHADNDSGASSPQDNVYQVALFNAIGLACLCLGTNAFISSFALSQFPVLFIISLAIGGMIGTWININARIQRFASRKGNADSVQGLITACLLFCIGTFSIVGPVLSCLSPSHGWDFSEPDNTFLYTNATLDLVTSAILAASYGWIIILAAPVLFCWQSMFYLLALYSGDAIPEPLRAELSIVGGVLILSSGLGILGIKDTKTVNLLPALLVPVVFYIIKGLL